MEQAALTPKSDRLFFLGSAIWFFILVFWGFSGSFYLNSELNSMPLHLKVHGISFSAWIILYALQISLITAKRIRLHMTLGFIGLILIIAMIFIGAYPVLYKVSVGTKSVLHGGYNLFLLATAFTLFFLGFYNRRKAFYHKRFMLFTTLFLAIAAIDRVAFYLDLEGSQLFRKSISLMPALVLFGYDLFRFKRAVWLNLLPVLILGLLFFLSDYFWLSTIGDSIMDFLVSLIGTPAPS